MGERGGEQVKINSEVIPVANEWGAVRSNRERGFFKFSAHNINGEVILVSSLLKSSCIQVFGRAPRKLGWEGCQRAPNVSVMLIR